MELLFALDGLNDHCESTKVRKRRELDNREVYLETKEKNWSSKSQKDEADICEKENMLRIQDKDMSE